MGSGDRYRSCWNQLDEVVRDCGRIPGSVKLIAVSKTVGVDEVKDAVAAGAHDFGENRPELLAEKAEALPDETWHFIGNIQSRRIPQIVEHATLIHSLYQERHIARIDAAARELGKIQDVLIEVNVSGEESKSGVVPGDALSMVQACLRYPNVRVCGFMTMAPQGDPYVARACFEGLSQLHAEVKRSLPVEAQDAFCELSMGMSEDWREAIESGATMVRVGRAIFSESFAG